MNRPDFRQDKPYRRGLILGLTMAEVMILLIFVLLMALAAALGNRDDRIAALDQGGAARLVEELQRAYPQARSSEDYFKELRLAIDARRTIEAGAPAEARRTLLEDAAIGREAREAAGAAAAAGARDPEAMARTLAADAETGRRAREAAAAAGARDPAAFARAAIDRMTRARGGRRGEWPPFFSLSEAGGYYFDSGKATLRPEFERNLRAAIIPLLARNIADYDVNVVEVIGHTDEVPMAGTSNLDRTLIGASANRVPIAALTSTDNAGLAIARAVAVVHVLRADPRLAGVTILPLSGAQMIVPTDRVADGTATGDDQRRRRIEIRLRRSSEQETAAIVRPGPAARPVMETTMADELDQNLSRLRAAVEARRRRTMPAPAPGPASAGVTDPPPPPPDVDIEAAAGPIAEGLPSALPPPTQIAPVASPAADANAAEAGGLAVDPGGNRSGADRERAGRPTANMERSRGSAMLDPRIERPSTGEELQPERVRVGLFVRFLRWFGYSR